MLVSHFHFSGLKLLLEPILQGVLETKFEYMMDFDEYFRQVKVISQRRVSVCMRQSESRWLQVMGFTVHATFTVTVVEYM